MRKKAVQQGRSERRGDYVLREYVEPLSDARTPLADFFRILLDHDEAMKLLRHRVDETVNGVNSMSNQWEERDA